MVLRENCGKQAPHGLPGRQAGRVSTSLTGVRAFTLIELLLVIAIIVVLASLLIPTLASVQAKGKRTVCLNNLKQAALSFQMYAADNDGRLAQNYPLPDPSSNAWVLGNMKLSADSTNQNLIRQGKLYPYASQVALYRCPADPSRTGHSPRVRSYAMNGWIGSRYMETYSPASGYRTFVRESELSAAGPARLWVINDEHEASIDDAYFLLTMKDGRPASLPATRHLHSFGLNFADGHADFFKMRNMSSPGGITYSAENPDWERFREATTVK